MMKSVSAWVVVALAVGLAAGAVIRSSFGAGALGAVEIAEAFGTLWLNTLSMTVVPLVFALVTTGVAAVDDARATGRLASRAIGLFSVLLVIAGAYGIFATQGLLTLWPIDRQAADAFVQSAPTGADAPPAAALDFAAWLRGLAPSNPVEAAAGNAILSLTVFAVFFGFALTRIAPAHKQQVLGLMRAIGEAMLVIVHWVLIAGPVGVLALAVGVGYRAGIGAAGVLLHYIAIVSIVTFGIAILAFVLAALFGRTSLSRFFAASSGALAVAAGTRSSIATLPAMLESAKERLRIPARVADLILPLAVSIFRFTSPAANLSVAMFVASLYGLQPDAPQIIGAIFVAFAVSIASVGLPGQVSFIASVAPICVALGVPVEVLGFLLAVEMAPDVFRTIGNVAGDLAVTTVLARGEKEAPDGEVRTAD